LLMNAVLVLRWGAALLCCAVLVFLRFLCAD
jgi:hypothetical protein